MRILGKILLSEVLFSISILFGFVSGFIIPRSNLEVVGISAITDAGPFTHIFKYFFYTFQNCQQGNQGCLTYVGVSIVIIFFALCCLALGKISYNLFSSVFENFQFRGSFVSIIFDFFIFFLWIFLLLPLFGLLILIFKLISYNL